MRSRPHCRCSHDRRSQKADGRLSRSSATRLVRVRRDAGRRSRKLPELVSAVDRCRPRQSSKVRGRFPSSLLCGSRRLSTWVSEGTPRLVSHSRQSQDQRGRLGRSSRNDGPAALRGSAAVTSNAGRLRACWRLLFVGLRYHRHLAGLVSVEYPVARTHRRSTGRETMMLRNHLLLLGYSTAVFLLFGSSTVAAVLIGIGAGWDCRNPPKLWTARNRRLDVRRGLPDRQLSARPKAVYNRTDPLCNQIKTAASRTSAGRALKRWASAIQLGHWPNHPVAVQREQSYRSCITAVQT
jgi:hypothetical protein